MPALIIQALTAVSGQFLKDDARKRVATILSVTSGIVLGMAAKFQWSQVAQKWSDAAKTFRMLSSTAYSKNNSFIFSLDNGLFECEH